MDFKFLSFLIFNYFIINSSSIYASLPFPNDSLPTKSGYLRVNDTTSSAIFYTFYEAQNLTTPLSQTPLLIWLQGGPGCSSMLGNFYELGPWRVSSSHIQKIEHVALNPNNRSWNRIFGLLFLDNPIGVGFSIAATPEEIPRNQKGVAKHLYIAIKKFIELNESFKDRPIYITGESYAGKYVPAIGYQVLKKNVMLPVRSRVNLAGVVIGNGLTDPISQVATHAANAYYFGLINEKQRKQLELLQEKAISLAKNGNWSEATNARSKVLNTLQNMTEMPTLYNIRRHKPYQNHLVAEFLNNVEVKKALGVNETIVFEVCSKVVREALHEDLMKSVKYMVEFLVKNTKVLLYEGQLDLRVGLVSTEAWVKRMKWEEIDKFLEADRKVWRVNDELAGYVQKWRNLSHVVVLDAGHLVPHDQPLNSQAMIEDWVLEKGVFANDQIENLSTNLFDVL
ncbi:serine carboxypeptidase-like 50 [Solanum pennellii]|uniref:Carboxypeptidase n=1 Tax=Solanum pennellii TaxID=28526 RepID=A0ABM1GRX9_SOLPN|nr:serine carboxypeptidase-like 50 [Solanum pennellii]